jgi:hypothetical protein
MYVKTVKRMTAIAQLAYKRSAYGYAFFGDWVVPARRNSDGSLV